MKKLFTGLMLLSSVCFSDCDVASKGFVEHKTTMLQVVAACNLPQKAFMKEQNPELTPTWDLFEYNATGNVQVKYLILFNKEIIQKIFVVPITAS